MPKVFHQLSQLSNYRAKPHPPNVLYHSHKIDLLLIHFEKTIERNQKCQMKHTHIDHWFNRKNMSNFHFSNCLIFCVVRNIWLTMEQFPFFLNLFIYLFIYWVILFIYLFILFIYLLGKILQKKNPNEWEFLVLPTPWPQKLLTTEKPSLFTYFSMISPIDL